MPQAHVWHVLRTLGLRCSRGAGLVCCLQGLRESIPPNFPYLYVQFGYGQGYVHVIDDESKFDRELGRQVGCAC